MADEQFERTGDHRGDEWVEITVLPPIEARVVAARLRASGIYVLLGPDSPYESVTASEGMPVLVPTKDEELARALLPDSPEPP